MKCKVLTMSERSECLLIIPMDASEEEGQELVGAEAGQVRVVCYSDLSHHSEAQARWVKQHIRKKGFCVLSVDRLMGEPAS